MTQVADRQAGYEPQFEAFRRDEAFGPAWLAGRRREAFERFGARGFPTTREEDWRFTNVAPIAAIPFERPNGAPADARALAPWLFGGAVPHQLVVVNGRIASGIAPAAALPAGVRVTSLRDLWRRHAGEPDHPALRPSGFVTGPAVTPFADLNAAFVEDGVVIEIAPGTVVSGPLHVLSVTAAGDAPVMASPRLVVIAGDRSQVSIVESFAAAGRGATFTNAVAHVSVGAGAIVDHVKLQREPDAAFHLASTFARLARDGVFRSHALTLGGRIARNDIVSILDGPGAECTLNGLYVATGDSLVDTHTTIDHAQPHCPSHEVYKGILGGRARAVFNGKIIVRPQAQKTDAKQTNRALLLTDDAQINTKPQLEIFADDVRCTHGAAIGQLDEDAMFYLRARGISEIDARNLLIHAFAGDVLTGVKTEAVRESAMVTIEEKLSLAHLTA
jgi:Fe-S cluster assembly protein SufD